MRWPACPTRTALTLDYEFSLPENATDLATYAQLAGWHNLTFDQEVNQVTLDYTRLVQMVAAAMHKQHRLLRVASLVRNNDMVDSEVTNVAPYLLDYGNLAKYADQLVLMAIDFHYQGGTPGPISPLADVTQVANYVRSYGVPLSKLAIEVPNYSYDWPVTASGANATNSSGQVIQASPAEPHPGGGADAGRRLAKAGDAGRRNPVQLHDHGRREDRTAHRVGLSHGDLLRESTAGEGAARGCDQHLANRQ